ncbi:MAG: hypothetical protein RL328_2337 [Acidobacteriota bacterium]|jgi:hypothetical protein
MRPRFALLLLVMGCAAIGLLHAQKPWAEYPGQTPARVPPDYKEPHEWVWGRLRYTGFGGFGGGGFGGGRRRGGFGGWGSWATDYPKGDRTLVSGLRRLTLLDTRSVEQTVDLDGSDDAFNWPFLYAVEVGRWQLTDTEVKQLRDFLDRGGFLMVDDFHCADEWESFMESFQLVTGDRDIVDIPDSDPIAHTVFELDLRTQIPGAQFNRGGRMNECGGRADPAPHWRAVYDKKQRIEVAIVHNSDLGDAIEYADTPSYPEEFAQAAFRILSNYVVYDLTH